MNFASFVARHSLALLMGVAVLRMAAACSSSSSTSNAPDESAGDGGATVIANAPGSTFHIKSDGNMLYWSNGFTLVSAPVSGGDSTTILDEAVVLIDVDDTALYFVKDSQFYSIPKSGGTMTLLSEGDGDVWVATRGSGGGLVWGRSTPRDSLPRDYIGPAFTIERSSADGRPPLPLGYSRAIPSALSASNTSAFALFGSAWLSILPLDGTLGDASAPLSHELRCSHTALLADETYAYCFTTNIDRIDSQGQMTTLLGSALTAQNGLVVAGMNSTHIYWVNTVLDGYNIMKISKQGGDAILVAHETAKVDAIAADDAAIYWISDSTMKRLAQ